MKSLILMGMIVFGCSTVAQSQKTLSGKIFDNQSKEPLPGATVYIAEIGSGTVSDIDGAYQLRNLPLRSFLIQVKYVGYITASKTIDLNVTEVFDFYLEPSVVESKEAVVTGSAFATDKRKSSFSIEQIQSKELLETSSQNIISALAQTPGIAEISTGGAISKPVIRGLGYNRIITISEGLRQEGQQWGDEHGIEIDQFSADRIEVLKGPASLLYGSDAMGGVINILEALPPQAGVVQGNLNTTYSTNNSLTANSLMFEGNQNGISYRLRGTYKNAAAYKTPDYTVYNSAFNETDFSLMAGINRKWGFSHLHASRWSSKIGMIEGERDSATGNFIDTEGNVVSSDDLESRQLNLPFQSISHDKISSVSSCYFNKSKLSLVLGYQQNNRSEFEDSETDASLIMKLQTASYDLKYFFAEKKGFETAIGISGMYQLNKNNGVDFLIPDYDLFDAGVFASVKKSFEKLTLNGGIRFDYRTITGNELYIDSVEYFSSFLTSFNAINASVGMAYNFNKTITAKLNAGRAFRAPNIAELGSNGLHEGTFRYEIGNPDLNPETSFQLDAEIDADSKYFNLTLSGFYNYISNYIYLNNLNGESITIDSADVYPVYRYVQGNSTLWGYEFSVDFHPIEEIHFYNSIAFVEGTNNETDMPLPFIPATKISNELMFHIHTDVKKLLRDPFIKFRADSWLKQDRIDAFETETDGYTLFSVSLGCDMKLGDRFASFHLSCNNLFDKAYYDHLSRLKPVGIYNMGRNITVGLSVPFGLYKKKD